MAGTKAQRAARIWGRMLPEAYAEYVARRAIEAAERIRAEHREDVQRYRLRVVDDDVSTEALFCFEGSHFTDPAEAAEYAREAYPAEWAHGLYEVDPVYRDADYRDRVPFVAPREDEEPRYAVAYVRDYRDPTSGHWCGTTALATAYVDRSTAERLLDELRERDPDFDGYDLVADRPEVEDEDYPEPPDAGEDPCDDGTIGYDYYGSSWPERGI